MSVSDKGDIQNVQSGGSRGTGLKTTVLGIASPELINITIIWVSRRPTAALSAYKSLLQNNILCMLDRTLKKPLLIILTGCDSEKKSLSKETGHWPIFQGQLFYESCFKLTEIEEAQQSSSNLHIRKLKWQGCINKYVFYISFAFVNSIGLSLV